MHSKHQSAPKEGKVSSILKFTSRTPPVDPIKVRMGALLKQIQQKNFYEIFHLDRHATLQEIKASYKEIAKTYHPDSQFYTEIIHEGPSNDAIEVFQLINEAYNTLLSSEKRAAYDKTLPPNLRGWEEAEERRPRERKPSGDGPGSINLSKFEPVVQKKLQEVKMQKAPQKPNVLKATILKMAYLFGALTIGVVVITKIL